MRCQDERLDAEVAEDAQRAQKKVPRGAAETRSAKEYYGSTESTEKMNLRAFARNSFFSVSFVVNTFRVSASPRAKPFSCDLCGLRVKPFLRQTRAVPRPPL